MRTIAASKRAARPRRSPLISKSRSTSLAKVPMLRKVIRRRLSMSVVSMTETVTRKANPVQEQRSCEQEMSSALEMTSMVQEAADAARTSNWKDRVQAAARILGLPFSRAKAFYYREDRRVTAEEMDLARERIEQHREEQLSAAHQQHLAWLYETVRQLHEAGEDVAGFEVDRLERAVARLGGSHRAVGYPLTDADPDYDQREYEGREG